MDNKISKSYYMSKAMEMPMNKPMEKAMKMPMKKHMEKAMEMPMNKPMEKAMEMPMNKPMEKAMEMPMNKPMEKAMEMPMNKPMEKAMETPMNKPMEKAMEMPMNKPMEKTMEMPMNKPMEKTMEMPMNKPMDMMHMKHVMIGSPAPDFEAITTFGKRSLSDYKGKWLILFSHPADFTPVCTTEFLAFAKDFQQFKKRNAELLALSVDGNSSHLAWVDNIYEKTGVEIPFPVIADSDRRIAHQYGMIHPGASDTQTVRTVFIIDPKQIVRAALSYPLTTGRYIPEIVRLLEALQVYDETGNPTPANWMPGTALVVPPPKTYEELKTRKNNPKDLCCMDWYLCFTDEGAEMVKLKK
jgi:peroxiredoxin (alkyl hydroperoxide reductase subunit C)